MSDSRYIVCKCSFYDLVSPGKVEQALSVLRERNIEPIVVNDLCGICSKKEKNSAPGTKGAAGIIACFPRAIKGMVSSIGLDPERTEVFNLRTEEISALPAFLDREISGTGLTGIKDIPGEWVPWFPVIDALRCSNCKQCMSFCLFGVFTLSKRGTVEVSNHADCKTNCPACGRICPETAIMFPKYSESPINGDSVTDEALAKQHAHAHAKELLGKDIYKGLEGRKEKRRRMILRRQQVEQAYKERENCNTSDNTGEK